jgi:LacI family transcriptional regulator, galactose operon repressor
MKDIARDLGISPMAVSKALRDHSDIGEETKRRVLHRAAEVNYRVDWVARSMVTGRTYLVGLVVPDLMQSFFAEIAGVLTASLAPAGYHLLISYTGENAKDEAENIDLLVSRKVDGLIIASAQRSAAAFDKLKTPYVLIDRKLSGLNANFVGTKNEDIGFLATSHLIEQGCRRVAHLRGPALSTAAGRLRGYRRALEKRGLAVRDELILEAGHDDASGYRAMKQLLSKGPRPDGVFCFNDPVAIGTMRAILDAGLSVPQDIAVIGAANMHYSDILRISLSTVDQGTTAIGQKAAQLLLENMSAKRPLKPAQILIPPELIVRASSKLIAAP